MRARVQPFVLIALVAAVAAGCAQEPPPHPYPEDLVTNFMTGCKRRTRESVCECALRRIQRRWTADEFRKLDETLGDAAAAQIAETVAACAGR